MKKAYIKPATIGNDETRGVVPAVTAITPALALLGGYAAGRAVKQIMEIRSLDSERKLKHVILV